MRPQSECLPDASDGVSTQAGLLRQQPCAPVRGVLRLGFKCEGDDPFDRVIGNLSRRSRAWLVEEPVDSVRNEARSPAANGSTSDTQSARNFFVVATLGTRQDNPCTQGQRLSGSTSPSETLELSTLFRAHGQHLFGSPAAHCCL